MILDFLSNGFKLREHDRMENASGEEHTSTWHLPKNL
jgi:hypothetical protein